MQNAARRPIDKQLKFVEKVSLNATQQETTLFTITFPCTLTGLRWSLGSTNTTGAGSYGWALVIVRDGATPKALALADGASFYQPEQDVLAYGAGISVTTEGELEQGNTKTMRKLMGGDKLFFVAKGTAGATTNMTGTIQFFLKV